MTPEQRERLPSKIGTEKTFEVHGHLFHVKRVSRSCFFLVCPLVSLRARFGDREQITEDIEQVLLTGVLPRCKIQVG